jgi:hypothetical protein
LAIVLLCARTVLLLLLQTKALASLEEELQWLEGDLKKAEEELEQFGATVPAGNMLVSNAARTAWNSSNSNAEVEPNGAASLAASSSSTQLQLSRKRTREVWQRECTAHVKQLGVLTCSLCYADAQESDADALLNLAKRSKVAKHMPDLQVSLSCNTGCYCMMLCCTWH